MPDLTPLIENIWFGYFCGALVTIAAFLWVDRWVAGQPKTPPSPNDQAKPLPSVSLSEGIIRLELPPGVKAATPNVPGPSAIGIEANEYGITEIRIITHQPKQQAPPIQLSWNPHDEACHHDYSILPGHHIILNRQFRLKVENGLNQALENVSVRLLRRASVTLALHCLSPSGGKTTHLRRF